MAADFFDGPLPRYRALVAHGDLKPDPLQELAAEKLQSLHHALVDYRPGANGGRQGWLSRFGLSNRPKAEMPQGLYLFGGVGRGKTMLMDLFCTHAPIEPKRRTHFNAFMKEVQERRHRWQDDRRAGRPVPDDPIPAIAADIAAKATLLCFDEFMVTDVADAMILQRLFGTLFDRGVVVVATSNRPPDALYSGGLNRDLFLPFIDLLKHKLDLLELDGPTDYRLARLLGSKVYHYPLGPAAGRALARAFADLTDQATPKPFDLLLKGRTLHLPKTAHGVAWCGFDTLCGQPTGVADYIALATHFHTLILEDIPRFGEAEKDKAARFRTLIDELYQHKVNLVASAAAAPDQLLAGLETHAFEFERTVSRLMEMQSRDYLQAPHLT